MVSFKGRHFLKDVILMLVRWYLAYVLSYRNIEELAKKRGLYVDYSTVQRWVVHYLPQLEKEFLGIYRQIEIRQVKYLNNIVEQDHRAIKRIIKSMMGFKDFKSAEAILAGIEFHYMLKKGQHINAANMSVFEQFYSLAA